MKSKQALTLAVMALLSALPVVAEPLDVKPGLWEITNATRLNTVPVPESTLQRLPLNERMRIKALLKKRLAQPPQTHTDKRCLTQETMQRAFDKRVDSAEETCTQAISTATATQQDYTLHCTGPAPRSGTVHVEAQSRERIKCAMQMTSPDGAVVSEVSGRWLGADCGKPN